MPYASISLAATGDVVAAVAGRRIRVISYLIVAADAVTAQWLSAANALSGVMTLAASTQLAAAPMPDAGGRAPKGHFETNPGEALRLGLGSSVQVSGHLVYELVP